MFIRLWRCCLMPAAAHQFDFFANTELLDFYRQQAGCLGMSVFCRDSVVMLFSYWQELEDAMQMELSPLHTKLVDRLRTQGWVLSAEPAEWVQLSGGFVCPQAISVWQRAHQISD